MSGESLRLLSITGNDNAVRSILKARANPCSSDEFGLTPLMYAVWNGHLECAKWLLANDRGIDGDGFKRSCINMVSLKGYSALHLHCKDSLAWSNEIIYWLLAAGADTRITCGSEGLTPEQHAQRGNNTHAIETLQLFETLTNCRDNNNPCSPNVQELRISLEKKRDILAKKYAFHQDASVTVEPWGANFPVPPFIFEPQRVGSLPHGLKVYEHQIKPLMEQGKEEMTGIDSIRCLSFVESQAELNRKRREEILKAQDPTWIVPEKVHFTSRIKKRIVKKRSKGDDPEDVVTSISLPIIEK